MEVKTNRFVKSDKKLISHKLFPLTENFVFISRTTQRYNEGVEYAQNYGGDSVAGLLRVLMLRGRMWH